MRTQTAHGCGREGKAERARRRGPGERTFPTTTLNEITAPASITAPGPTTAPAQMIAPLACTWSPITTLSCRWHPSMSARIPIRQRRPTTDLRTSVSSPMSVPAPITVSAPISALRATVTCSRGEAAAHARPHSSRGLRDDRLNLKPLRSRWGRERNAEAGTTTVTSLSELHSNARRATARKRTPSSWYTFRRLYV